jgi:hypothetical protein
MRFLALSLSAALLLPAVQQIRADDSLESSMRELAQTTKDLLGKEGQTAVAIGEFSPSTRVRLADRNAVPPIEIDRGQQ